MVSNIKQSPLVSITCLTYNHAPYLRQCLDGFVMQKTSFPIEILIYDDASEDGTQDIIREYERKYPDLIKPIYQTENQYSKGVKVEFVYNYPRAKGKYIAFCEGDDYWTDPNKLQKQIDFLERHQEHVMCSHQYKLYFQKEKIMDHAIRPIGNFSDGISFDLSFLIRGGWLFQPLSVVFRKSALDLNMYSKYAIHIDVVLLYAILKNGKGGFSFRQTEIKKYFDRPAADAFCTAVWRRIYCAVYAQLCRLEKCRTRPRRRNLPGHAIFSDCRLF